MGMYDTFYGRYRCPACGKDADFEEPVKGFAELLEDYYLGDICDAGDANYFHYLATECPSCRAENRIALAIRNGQYAKAMPADEADRTPITEIENIEESLERKRMHGEMCRNLAGWEQVKTDAESFVEEKKPGDTVTALRHEWTVDGEYHDPGERPGPFDELFDMVNRSYRVHCGGVKRILTVRRNAAREVWITVWEEEPETE